MVESNNSNQSFQEDPENDVQESISKKIELNDRNSSNSKIHSIKMQQFSFFGGNSKEKYDDDKSLKRSYCKLNQEVLDYLNQFFEEKNYPSRKEIQSIANKFNFNFVKVDNWFKHKRRQQSKKDNPFQSIKILFCSIAWLNAFNQPINNTKKCNFYLINKLTKSAFLTQCDIKNVKNWFSYKRKQFYKQYRKNIPDDINFKSDSCSLNSECQENADNDNNPLQSQPNSSEFQRSLNEFIESQIPEKFLEGYKDGTLLMEFLKGKVQEMKQKSEFQQPIQDNHNTINNTIINTNNSNANQSQFQLNPQQIQLAIQLALLANNQKKQQEAAAGQQQPQQQINVSQNTTNFSNNFNIFQFPQSNTLFQQSQQQQQQQSSQQTTPLPLPFIINQSSDNVQPVSKEQNVQIESILSTIFNQNSNKEMQPQKQQQQSKTEDN